MVPSTGSTTARIPINKFHYRCLTQTNYHGWQIPTAFDFVQFRFDATGKSTRAVSGDGRITQIKAAAPRSNVLFNPHESQTVMDFRFPDAQGRLSSIIYENTTNHVLPVTDERLALVHWEATNRAARYEEASQLPLR